MSLTKLEEITAGASLGVRAVRSSWPSLALLTIISTLLDAGLMELARRVPESPPEQILLIAANVILSSWVLVAIISLSFARFQPSRETLSAILAQSFLYLPKTFFSLCVMIFVLSSAVRLPIVLPSAILFIWAPFFVTAELFATGDERPIDPEDFDPDEPHPVFLRQGIFDLGVQRAVRFGLAHYDLTLRTLVYGLAFCLFAFSGAHFVALHLAVPWPELIASFVSSAVEIAFLVVIFHAFLFALPVEALREFRFLKVESLERRMIPWINDLFVRWLPLLLSVGIAVGCAWYINKTVFLSALPK